ncbi:TIGR00725 family protein [Candidatus Woesearchaeota archaeon]|nr:TIGR00725 family protein [Candidatus Woesearchaeota archaeon]
MTKRTQIVVIGSSKSICTKKAYDIAVEVGEELAKRNCITLTGGGMGVMEAALKGAKKEKGLTVGIIPWESIKKVNKYADVTIATGIGWSRDAINVNSCDGAIIIHGGAGTLNEATYGYIRLKPMVAIRTSGGIAKQFAGKHLDVRKTAKIESADSAKEAVRKVLSLIEKNRKKKTIITEFDKDMLHLDDKQDWKQVIKQLKKKSQE